LLISKEKIMKQLSKVESRQESGFTLVELAVVMVIIGLLIGGILKGQELIANAQVTATIAQLKGFEAGITTFRDKYGQLPGDMNNGGARLNNCTGNCAGNGGTGDGRIGGLDSVLVAHPANSENMRAFYHLSAAGLIQGVIVNGAMRFGEGVPAAKAGGGFRIGYDNDGGGIGGLANFRPGHFLTISNQPTGAIAGGNGILPGSQAGQIDRKLDDGRSRQGSVGAFGTACDNGAANGGIYDEQDDGLCVVVVQIQG
jgi:prepilin-type N-terminal cleavage/methylation domain-containing protein